MTMTPSLLRLTAFEEIRRTRDGIPVFSVQVRDVLTGDSEAFETSETIRAPHRFRIGRTRYARSISAHNSEDGQSPRILDAIEFATHEAAA